MSRTAPKNALYAQSGGVSAVINATAAASSRRRQRHKRHIGKLYAGPPRHRRRARAKT